VDVSVIIPAYNCEKTIIPLLEALKLQETNLSYEVIVVNNASNDGTNEILLAYKDNFPTPLQITEQPRGVTIASVRNHGAKCSHGKILAFIDSDCEPPADWIQKGKTFLDNYGDDALLAGGCCPPVNGTWVERAWHSIRAGHKEGSIFVHGANFFITKALFEKVGGFRANIETSEDYDLGRRVAKNHKVISAPEFSVVHYGEANTLYKKIVKERWYSRNMFETLSTNIFYKPFWISLLFLTFILLFGLSILFMEFKITVFAVVGMLGVAAFLSLYFCSRANTYSCILPLVPVSFAYLFGRSLGIIDSLFIAISRKKQGF